MTGTMGGSGRIAIWRTAQAEGDAPQVAMQRVGLIATLWRNGRLWWKPVFAKTSDKRDILFMLRPYWIKTDQPSGLGYGITARSEEDAETLLRLVTFSDCVMISIKPVKDAASLDQGHVIPNMGNMLCRCIWYPLGYQHLTD